ncbi:MAG: hypothetical protein MUC48_25135, partial [Leptolyngbya sp. Prado105]|nr:hypothetical protein [Leptolyngbya sp. Prado105]
MFTNPESILPGIPVTNPETTHPQHASTQGAVSTRPTLTLTDAIAIIVGIVIGAGIFETPALVAANSDRPAAVLGTWLAGGAVSFLGAL